MMKMSSSLLKLAAVGLFATPLLLQAEGDKPGRPPGDRPGRPLGDKPGGPGERMDPAARLRMMREKLGLTDEQTAKMKAIFEKDGPAMKEIMSKGRENLTEADKAKLKEMMKAQREEISTVLTPEQLAKMKEGREGGPGDRPKRPGDAPKK
jgi:Spy/CpxP family protein refolding chaperone